MAAQGVTASVHIDGAQLRRVLLSLQDYLRIAYKVKDYHSGAGLDGFGAIRHRGEDRCRKWWGRCLPTGSR